MRWLKNFKDRLRELWHACFKNKKLSFGTFGVLVVIIIVAAWALTSGSPASTRTEAYETIQGAAGLNATIMYDCQTNCDRKFDFNVYIFSESGHQVSVLRPTKEGEVNAALSGGNYIMLIGKQMGKDGLFPEERLVLKNGKELNIKLQYKEGEL